MAEVEFRGVSRRFGDVVALHGLDLSVADGEFLILVGPSGCGKSTALRLLAGLDKPTSGEILIAGRSVTRLGPGERDIAMVFQNYALYPHMSVFQNLAYGLRQRRTPRAEVDRRVRETADLLDIDQLLDRKPGQLSGGQRQRVAMGRALVRRPQAFLLDEPLVQPRREAAHAGAGRPQATAPRAAGHLDLRHARPGRGDDARRPDLRDVERRGPADRHRPTRSTTTRPTPSSPASWAARR